MEDLKKQRSKEKSALSKLCSKLNRCVQERSKDDVTQCIEEMKKKYRDFEKTHDSIHEQLEDVPEIEASDSYLIDVEDKYSESLEKANEWLSSLEQMNSKKDVSSMVDKGHDKNLMTKDMIAMFNLPRLELDTFDGDPLQYHSFLGVFEETVEKVVTDGSAKLTRLLRYTSGAAKAAIKPCAIIGGEKGYLLAKRTLFEKFGTDLIISENLISSLRSEKPVRSAADL